MIIMILYTKQDCPLCSVAKVKLNAAKIEYSICKDEELMKEKDFKMLPILELNDGTLLIFQEIIEGLKKGVIK